MIAVVFQFFLFCIIKTVKTTIKENVEAFYCSVDWNLCICMTDCTAGWK